MKNKWLVMIVVLTIITGCERQDNVKPVVNIDISKLNQQRTVTKNMIDFENNEQGKNNLLMLMVNSVDCYNLVSGKMSVTSTYLSNSLQTKYEFQINIPNYQSYLYQSSSSGYSEQVMFRDSERMYFFTGDRSDLDNYSFKELVNKKQISVEEISRDNNLFKFADWELKDRINNLNVSRVANDLYGDIAPYLFPEDIALRQLSINNDSFEIKGKEIYLDRTVFLIEAKIDNDLYVEGATLSMLVDQQTGVVLKYNRISNDSKVEMVIESISIDNDNEVDMYDKYVK